MILNNKILCQGKKYVTVRLTDGTDRSRGIQSWR